jgi:hypothetical protein
LNARALAAAGVECLDCEARAGRRHVLLTGVLRALLTVEELETAGGEA